MNSKKTLAEGRRIPKSRCVENPTYQEIRDVLVSVGLHVSFSLFEFLLVVDLFIPKIFFCENRMRII